jgi:iron(III) transport system permease protein
MTTLAAYPVPHRRRPWHLWVPAGVCLGGMLLPLVYLLIRASEADVGFLRNEILRPRTLVLLLNTLGLAASVLATVTVVGVPMAWLTTRSDLKARRLLTLLAVLPLAVPGYLMAYTLLAAGGPYGTGQRLLGIQLPRLTGFWGALLALSLYNLPYMFLNLRVAMQRIDPALEEVARSLGHSPMQVFWRVTVPRLRPALWAGTLLIGLHVIGDFGVVSLLRFETFSFALYKQVEAGDRIGAAWLGLILIALTSGLLLVELRFLRGLRLDPAGMASARVQRVVRLGHWAWPAYTLLLAIAFVSLVVPLGTMIYWFGQADVDGNLLGRWARSLGDSVSASIPAAVLACLAAIPICYLARRYPSPASRGVEQAMYLGYATPALAFALGLVFFSLRAAPFLYQTLALLVVAYALHFLAEALGPLRTALFVATPRMEEASRSLGHGRLSTFVRVTLPLLRPGMIVSLALVFLSVMKELPIAFILAPLDFHPLSLKVWDYTNEALYAQAAPYALTILLLSAGFVGLLLMQGPEERST